jgi:hypothetical protein
MRLSKAEVKEKLLAQEVTCVACGEQATQYCEGWNTAEGKKTKYGQFVFSSQCGYPLCDKCQHEDH